MVWTRRMQDMSWFSSLKLTIPESLRGVSNAASILRQDNNTMSNWQMKRRFMSLGGLDLPSITFDLVLKSLFQFIFSLSLIWCAFRAGHSWPFRQMTINKLVGFQVTNSVEVAKKPLFIQSRHLNDLIPSFC